MGKRSVLLLVSLACLAAFQGVGASAALIPPQERDRVRFKLESLYNEMDLLIRNRNADLSDLRRQDRDAEALRVYERIPFKEDLEGLRRNLVESAQAAGVKLVRVELLARSPEPRPVPRKVYVDGPRFRIAPEQLVQELKFQAWVKGERASVENWIRSWQTQQLRLVEPEGGYGKLPMKPARPAPAEAAEEEPSEWTVRAQAFRFREVSFPELVARDPVLLLPAPARKDPHAFAQEDPALWSYVSRIRALAPKAKPYYDARREFLLKSARMEFFLSKADPARTNSKAPASR